MIREYENFISDQECMIILQWFISQKKNAYNCESLFSNRTIPYTSVDNLEIKRIVNKYRFKATTAVSELYGEQLYPDYTD